MANRKLQWGWFVSLLITPVVLWILPAGFFDGDGLVLCPSRLFFDIECLGCGMTRAVMHMHHLEIEDAIFYNSGVVVVFPALVAIWCVWVFKAARTLGLVNKGDSGKPGKEG